MHVLHINPDYPYQALYLNMLRHLDKSGIHKHTMYVPLLVGRKYNYEYDYISDRVRVIQSYDFNKLDRLLYFSRCKKIARALEAPLPFGMPDLIHCHYLFNSAYIAMKLKKKWGIEYISAVRNSDMNGYFRLMPWSRNLGLEIMQEAAYVIFLSPSYQETVIRKYVPPRWQEHIKAKSKIIPNAIADFWLKEKPHSKMRRNDHEVRLLYVGEWTRNKNIETIVQVADNLYHNGHRVSLQIVGDGPNRDRIHQLTTQRPEYVSTHPWVRDRSELLNIYRSCDVFIMPSLAESFGIVYVEAMSQGLPVIYTRGQGIDGFFEDGTIGYGCDPRNVESISQAVEMIMADYNNISKNCIEAARKFNWTDIAREYNQLYETIVHRRGKDL